jgi:hypothetical protein
MAEKIANDYPVITLTPADVAALLVAVRETAREAAFEAMQKAMQKPKR